VAKAVAASLNNTQIGGGHRSRYHDDIWNIRYLSGFKWEHLSEKIGMTLIALSGYGDGDGDGDVV